MFVALFPDPFAVVAANMVDVEAPEDDVACNLIVVVAARVITALSGKTILIPETDV